MQNKYRGRYELVLCIDVQTGKVLLRMLADAIPTERARTVAPTLEDYYLHVFDASGT